MTQREKPGVTKEQLEKALKLTPRRDNYVSGGQEESFQEGWAKAMFVGKLAHWFKRDGFDKAISLCGVETPVRWVHGPGNFPKCTKCLTVRRFKNKYD